MCNNQKNFIVFEKLPSLIDTTVSNGSIAVATYHAIACIGNSKANALYTPTFQVCLLSINQLDRSGATATFENGICTTPSPGRLTGPAEEADILGLPQEEVHVEVLETENTDHQTSGTDGCPRREGGKGHGSMEEKNGEHAQSKAARGRATQTANHHRREPPLASPPQEPRPGRITRSMATAHIAEVDMVARALAATTVNGDPSSYKEAMASP